MKLAREPITYDELKEGVRIIRNNTTSTSNPDGTFSIHLHGNLIAILYFNGSVKLFSGGNLSKTTRSRMNACIRHTNKYILNYKKEPFIYVAPPDPVIPFKEGMIIDP